MLNLEVKLSSNWLISKVLNSKSNREYLNFLKTTRTIITKSMRLTHIERTNFHFAYWHLPIITLKVDFTYVIWTRFSCRTTVITTLYTLMTLPPITQENTFKNIFKRRTSRNISSKSLSISRTRKHWRTFI